MEAIDIYIFSHMNYRKMERKETSPSNLCASPKGELYGHVRHKSKRRKLTLKRGILQHNMRKQ